MMNDPAAYMDKMMKEMLNKSIEMMKNMVEK